MDGVLGLINSLLISFISSVVKNTDCLGGRHTNQEVILEPNLALVLKFARA